MSLRLIMVYKGHILIQLDPSLKFHQIKLVFVPQLSLNLRGRVFGAKTAPTDGRGRSLGRSTCRRSRRCPISTTVVYQILDRGQLGIMGAFISAACCGVWHMSTGCPMCSRTWVGLTLICEFHPTCLAGQPLLPNSHQPRQNLADSGTPKIQVNPTQGDKQMGHPVQSDPTSMRLSQ